MEKNTLKTFSLYERHIRFLGGVKNKSKFIQDLIDKEINKKREREIKVQKKMEKEMRSNYG